MTSNLSPLLDLTSQARDALRAAARASRRREQGGILVGYRTPNGIHIEDVLLVADLGAAHTHYLRRAKGAEKVLTDYLKHGIDPFVGYVGEWHTHPCPVPPSRTDRTSMRIMSLRNSNPVALVVAALEHNHRDVLLYALVSHQKAINHRILGRHSNAQINTLG